MSTRTIILCTIFVLLCLCLTETYGLKCYVCGPDENCDREYQTQTVNCGMNNPTNFNYQCVKYLIGNSVARGCFLETFCTQQPYCYPCSYDYCNNGNNLKVGYTVLLLLVPLLPYVKQLV